MQALNILYENEVLRLISSFVICVVLVLSLDHFSLARPVFSKAMEKYLADISIYPARYVDVLWHLLTIIFVFLVFFAVSWRPIYSCHATITYFAVFMLISRVKYRFIREPLVFSDLAFVIDMFRHKNLFYTRFLGSLSVVAIITYVVGSSSIYMVYEPSILPSIYPSIFIVFGVVLAALPSVALALTANDPRYMKWAKTLLATFDPQICVLRFGTYASVLLQYVVWLTKNPKGERESSATSETRGDKRSITRSSNGEVAPLIVVWQSESFIDLRHFGAEDVHLPNLDRLRQRAMQWGRLEAIFEGGYTLRTEFSVLTGLPPSKLSIDASYPYLRAKNYADLAWPRRLRDAGWYTHFIHPYDAAFFQRDKAIPELGFTNMSMLDEFDFDRNLHGPYVPDRMLTERVVDIVSSLSTDVPAFLFVASMANHGPWEKGRHEGLEDPVEIYKRLLMEADAALGQLFAELEILARPVVLGFYGDHAPLLKNFADPFPDPRTDYVIVSNYEDEGIPKSSSLETAGVPWSFIQRILEHAGVLEARG